MAKPVAKYLSQYAENEVKQLASFGQHTYEQVIVIPAYKESDGFVRHLRTSQLKSQKVLLVVVVNQPDTDSDTSAQKRLFTQLEAFGEQVWLSENKQLSLVALAGEESASAILLVDRFTTPIPAKQGVGLARKIGADLALALHQTGNISSDWFCSTDADSSLPSNYFAFLHQLTPDTCLAGFNFSHQSENKVVEQANQQYEQALRYFQAGLVYANSPQAFFTIGSALAFRFNEYSQCRGFPKKAAGEDFYLVNKMLKLGTGQFFDDIVINIEARPSARVPFGTGPAVQSIMALSESGEEYHYYHPKVFDHLKEVIHAFDDLFINKDKLSQWVQALSLISGNALQSLNITDFVEKHQHHQQVQFNKQLVVWFDAFKTLKFIHSAKQQGLADIPLTEGIARAQFRTPPNPLSETRNKNTLQE